MVCPWVHRLPGWSTVVALEPDRDQLAADHETGEEGDRAGDLADAVEVDRRHQDGQREQARDAYGDDVPPEPARHLRALPTRRAPRPQEQAYPEPVYSGYVLMTRSY